MLQQLQLMVFDFSGQICTCNSLMVFSSIESSDSMPLLRVFPACNAVQLLGCLPAYRALLSYLSCILCTYYKLLLLVASHHFVSWASFTSLFVFTVCLPCHGQWTCLALSHAMEFLHKTQSKLIRFPNFVFGEPWHNVTLC